MYTYLNHTLGALVHILPEDGGIQTLLLPLTSVQEHFLYSADLNKAPMGP
tara:strand:+ start:659 stop:808 length:150 start_codon:yes stop_codon:yes gene_type:complete